MEGYNNYAEK